MSTGCVMRDARANSTRILQKKLYIEISSHVCNAIKKISDQFSFQCQNCIASYNRYAYRSFIATIVREKPLI